MTNLSSSRVLPFSVLVLVMLNPIAHIFAVRNSAAQAMPTFGPLTYRLVNADTGALLGIDDNGAVHADGDHRFDHVCFYYHTSEVGVVMLESTSGLGFVTLDSQGNVVLSNDHFSDEEQEDSGSGLLVFYRRFKASYSSGRSSSHTQVQLESEELPGCSLAFDSEGVAFNACCHKDVEPTKFTLLRSGC